MTKTTLCGTIAAIIFRNEQNGYTVLDLAVQADPEQSSLLADDPITAVGVLSTVQPGEMVELSGQWITHREYGMQFQFDFCQSVLPQQSDAIEKYLAGGLIKGVGPQTAKNIVRAFGSDTFSIIENEMIRLTEVKGISRNRALQIHESFIEQSTTRKVLLALQNYGITTHQALQLFKEYGEDAVRILQQNPYQLINDVTGIGFKMADELAQNIGLAFDSPLRICAAVRFTLSWAKNEGGHTCLPKEELTNLAARALKIEETLVVEQLQELVLQNELLAFSLEQMDFVALPALYHFESRSAKKLITLCAHPTVATKINLEQELRALERESGIELDKTQKKAIYSAFEKGVLVITGGPGTGKTTIINFILLLMQKMGMNCELCAPTGRAAKRMSEATGNEARTIHRLLEYTGEAFMRDEKNPVDCDVLIVDEMSMVDVSLFYRLLLAIEQGTRVILAGDADQLPSVGAGNVLHDIIESNCLPVVQLTQIFRQASLSRIITNAHRINQGEMPQLDFCDEFAFEEISSNQVILQRIIGICQRKKLGDPWSTLQLLSPTKKGALGVKNLNICLQEALNPPERNKSEITFRDTIFRTGDKIMQIKNDYNIEWTRPTAGGVEQGTGVFNGDMGIAVEVDKRDRKIQVLFDDDRTAFYEFEQLECLDLAYCISIHKSQGSEFPIVMLPMFFGPPLLMTRNLLYTAVTRARNCVVLLGQEAAIRKMVSNTQERLRYSMLKYCLRAIAPLYLESDGDTTE